MTVFTIGYEGLDIDAFMSLLGQHGIETIVDIRELPLSRKRGFSKKALATALDSDGRGYLHVPVLGCPKPVRDRYRSDGDWKRYTKGFIKHLGEQKGALEQVSVMTKNSSCALLCFEADFNVCHRSLVADALRKDFGADVQHIRS
jgi:uncharacterized protein (DUF488 family)